MSANTFPIPLQSMSDQQRHDYILKHYVLNQPARRKVHDIDVIKQHHRFLWDEEQNAADEDSWEVRLARRYYDKLFKEYCIADLSCYKQNKLALRWRTEAEVVTGKGQFQCGSRKCESCDNLRSWEVNFAYQEQGTRKNALVKLRLCEAHSAQLNYTSRKREVKRLKRSEKTKAKQQRRKMIDSESINEEVPPASATQKPSEAVEQQKNTEAAESATEAETQAPDMIAEDVWSRKPEMDLETQTRETDFERYLEDLLL